MRKLVFDVAGKARSVALEKTEGGYKAAVDDHGYEIKAARMEGGVLLLEVDGERFKVFIGADGGRYDVAVEDEIHSIERAVDDAVQSNAFMEEKREGNTVTAPMPGKVIKIQCAEGDQVSSGQTLAVIEAMKMENSITAHRDAVIKKIHVSTGDQVNLSQPIIELEEAQSEQAN